VRQDQARDGDPQAEVGADRVGPAPDDEVATLDEPGLVCLRFVERWRC